MEIECENNSPQQKQNPTSDNEKKTTTINNNNKRAVDEKSMIYFASNANEQKVEKKAHKYNAPHNWIGALRVHIAQSKQPFMQ